MRTAAVLVAACLAQPALAQWGLYGFSDEGLVYQIDEFTGERELVGDIGDAVVGASIYRTAWRNFQYFAVLTVNDEVIELNLRDFSTTPIMKLTGRPAGYTPVAFEYWHTSSPSFWVVMDSPSGEDVMFRASALTGVYEMVVPLGLSDVVEMNYGSLLTESGVVYKQITGPAWKPNFTVKVGEPLNAMSGSHCGTVFLGAGAYLYNGSVTRIAPSGFEDIRTLAYSSAWGYGCNLDISTGFAVCDIFDFLEFMNGWVAGELFACDCSTSTGSGVCDVFDFLCFQQAWVEGAHAQGQCR